MKAGGAHARFMPMSTAPLVQQLRRGALHPLFPGIAVAGVGFAILAGAYAFQYLGGLAPCPLCLEQRVPWFVLIGLGGAIVGAHSGQAPKPLLLGLYASAVAVAVWGAYLGLYHAGIEYTWWPGPPSCTGSGISTEGSLLGPLDTSKVVLCDVAPWTLMGISLAGFNFLFSLGVAAVAAWGGWRSR
jgi:disulfide bond formation protein DsbB